MVTRPLLRLTRLIVLFAFVFGTSTLARAQSEATLSGSITDVSKGALPGVTVTVSETTSGRQYVSVTDGRGEYRFPSVLPGAYKVTAELDKFSTAVVARVDLLVGQSVSLPLTLALAAQAETVVVTNETPIIDTVSVAVGGNIDRRQMEELPIQGRNWMELSMLVKGVTTNDVGSNRPAAREDLLQLNLDGQQITQQVAGSGGFGQPRMSREAISEYQVLTNMYDVTMGRSAGVQVQAVSRAGTNQLHGSAYGYFRDDRFNGKDFVANRVLPYSNRQMGFSLGGPLVTNKMHYFATYESEREPQTSVSSPSALPGQTLALPTKITQQSFLARVDRQISNKDHLVVRGTYSDYAEPFAAASGNNYPTSAVNRSRYSTIVTANLSRVLSNNAVQELKLGYYYYYWKYDLGTGVPQLPNYAFPGFSVVSGFSFPQVLWQRMPSARYDLTWHRGNHDVKLGGEYLHRKDGGWWPRNARGTFTFSSLPSDIARRFPIDAWNDPKRWDLSGLDSTVTRYTQSFARSYDIDIPRKTWALWLGDTWAVSGRLTLNAGVRWDVDWGALAPPGPAGTEFKDVTLIMNNGFDNNVDVGYKASIRNLADIAPRVGLTFKATDDLVLRGGVGVFYSTQISNLTFNEQLENGQNTLAMQFNNDGLPGFLQDPLRGKTADDVLSGKVPVSRQDIRTISPDYKSPRTYQGALGFEQQIGKVYGFDSDLVYARGANLSLQRDINLFFDPVTGQAKNPTTSGRPLAQYGTITWYQSTLKSEQLALANSFTRRFRDRWQAGLTYTLTFFQKDEGTGDSGYSASVNNLFCISCEYADSNAYQRHTLRLNGVYQAPWDITIAGVYSYGSGTRYATTFAGNPLGIGSGPAIGAINRINSGTTTVTIPDTTTLNGEAISVKDRFDGPATFAPGALVPRNALIGLPLSKFDLRASKDFQIPRSSVKLTGTFEVFNVFNHANYGAYNGVVGSATFGQPVQSTNLAYLPRTIQLAIRASF